MHGDIIKDSWWSYSQWSETYSILSLFTLNMGPSATLTKPMFVFVIEFQSFPFMLMRLVIGQYLLCKFCIPALFKPNFCDVSKIQKIQNFVWGPKSENLEFEYQRMGGWLQGTWWNPYTERYWLQTVNSSNIWKKYLNLYCSCGWTSTS